MRRDSRSPEAVQWRRLYKTARWGRLREAQLSAQPLCEMCLRMGVVEEATVVDHIVPHRGDDRLFWDPTNLQSLCATHHNSTKQSSERTGVAAVQFGPDGWPI